MSKPDRTANKPSRSFAQLFGFAPATTADAARQQQQHRPVWSRVADALHMAHLVSLVGLVGLVGLGKPTQPGRGAPAATPVPARAAPRRVGKPPVPTRRATTPRPPVVNLAAAALDAARAAARAKGHAAGWAAGRTRWAAVFGHRLAFQHPREAARLAAEDGLTVEQVHAMLDRLPDRVRLSAARAARNPRVGV